MFYALRLRRDSPAVFLTLGTCLISDAAYAADGNDGVLILASIFILVVLLIYFIPTIVAFRREHPNRWVILILNLVLGGTVLVWLICLIWASKAIHVAERRQDPGASNGGESGLNVFVNDEKRVRLIQHTGIAGQTLAVTRTIDPSTKLFRLKGLLDAGAITQLEFDDLKRTILREIVN